MEKYFPFDSFRGDRIYKSNDWVDYYKYFVTTGLCHDNGEVGLNLVAVNNYEITLSKGEAFIGGRNYVNTSDKSLIVNLAEDNMYRRDIIVLRCDTRMSARDIKLMVLKGEPALTEEAAKAPEIIRGEFIYDLGLYTILTRPQATSIRIDDITDVRGQLEYCQLSNPRGFGGASLFRGPNEPPKQFTKSGDIWMDELEE